MEQIEKQIFIGGARKAGTTTLYEVLTNHKDVNKPDFKEPNLFALDEITVEENLSWYKNLFSGGNDKALLDASTIYLTSERALKNINKFVKNPKILFLIRDPAKRAYSGYLHMNSKYPCPENRSFNEIINSVEGSEEDQIIKTENANIQKSIEEGKINTNLGYDYDKNYLKRKHGASFKSEFEDKIKLWNYKHFQGSLYKNRIKKYKEQFPNKVKIIIFEKLISEPKNVMKGILEFIDLEIESKVLKLPQANKTVMPSNKIAKIIEILIKNPLIGKIIEILSGLGLSKYLRSIRNSIYSPKPTLSEEQYQKARKILKNEYKYWFSKHEWLNEYWVY